MTLVQYKAALVLVVVVLDMGCVPQVPRCVPVTATGRVRAAMNPNVMATHTSVMEKVIF